MARFPRALAPMLMHKANALLTFDLSDYLVKSTKPGHDSRRRGAAAGSSARGRGRPKISVMTDPSLTLPPSNIFINGIPAMQEGLRFEIDRPIFVRPRWASWRAASLGWRRGSTRETT